MIHRLALAALGLGCLLVLALLGWVVLRFRGWRLAAACRREAWTSLASCLVVVAGRHLGSESTPPSYEPTGRLGTRDGQVLWEPSRNARSWAVRSWTWSADAVECLHEEIVWKPVIGRTREMHLRIAGVVYVIWLYNEAGSQPWSGGGRREASSP